MTEPVDPFIDGQGGMLTLTELRVLDGLSRGAALPLDESVKIGSDVSCDLLLVDEGIEPEQAWLSPSSEGRWTLTQAGGAGRAPRSELVAPGVPFQVGGVRMVVCESDAPWDFALPVSPAVPAPGPSAIDAAVADGIASGRLGAKAIAGATSRKPRHRRNLRSVLVGAGLLLLIGGAAFIYLDQNEPVPTHVAAPARRMYPESEVQDVAQRFAERLGELNIRNMKLLTAPQQLTVQGYLDRAAEARFENAVQELRDTHPGLRVKLELGAEQVSALPFEITAAVGGATGSVLLDDGQQLFVGAEEQGFKFLGLYGNCVSFLQVATRQKVSECFDQNQRRP